MDSGIIIDVPKIMDSVNTGMNIPVGSGETTWGMLICFICALYLLYKLVGSGKR